MPNPRLLLCLCALLLPPVAWCQGDPIEKYLLSAERKANDVAYNGGAKGRAAVMEAGQAALNAIANFRAAYGSSLKLTSDQLSTEEQKAFQGIYSSIDALDNANSMATERLQEISDTLAVAVPSIRFSREIPRVTRITGLYSIEGLDRPNEIVVKGMGLSNNKPVLEVKGKQYPPSAANESELKFSMPRLSALSGKPSLLQAKIRLFERRRGLLFDSFESLSYPLRLAIYPSQVGDITVIPRREVPVAETRSVSTPLYRCESPHGEGSASVPVNIAPTPGWTLIVESIRYNRSYSNNGSFTMNTTSATGITATLSCRGFGVVRGPFGVFIDHGNQGVEQGTFSYVETKVGSKFEEGEPKHAVLRWGETITVADLPRDTRTAIVRLKAFSGEILDLVGEGSNRFLRTRFDEGGKVLTISAAGIEQALRQ